MKLLRSLRTFEVATRDSRVHAEFKSLPHEEENTSQHRQRPPASTPWCEKKQVTFDLSIMAGNLLISRPWWGNEVEGNGV